MDWFSTYNWNWDLGLHKRKKMATWRGGNNGDCDGGVVDGGYDVGDVVGVG